MSKEPAKSVRSISGKGENHPLSSFTFRTPTLQTVSAKLLSPLLTYVHSAYVSRRHIHRRQVQRVQQVLAPLSLRRIVAFPTHYECQHSPTILQHLEIKEIRKMNETEKSTDLSDHSAP